MTDQPQEMHWIAKHTLKILFFLFLIFMLILGIREVYGEPKLKYYSIPNKTECVDNIHLFFNTTYMKNVKQILFFQKSNGNYLGQFYPNSIYIFYGCNDAYTTLFHELVHQCQWDRKDRWNNMVYHIGWWDDCILKVHESLQK